ncbi:MAG: hypothetical protein BGO45_07245 [Microbacterium sp. 71-36]|uniref:hypothetical protein n=1 Tax=unclassified Microbacterium TaxID=2609290 RepID=UPI000868CFC7|nr:MULTISPECIES: hypothetical protein [unclassified Microbacterium]MBN9211550.1 hypothetical protein [Microbacterium sp.]ODT37759.1 MAG: hypothetical protein ABS60_12270 [Microbacterium sp. SCN 71-17]OJV75456.1 MAG: hypothetical protein BGO45_07245 [Microbacterium sp. 71-36]
MTPALAAALARADAADAAGAAPGIAPRRGAGDGPVSKTRRIARVAYGVSWTLDRKGRDER